MRSCSERGSPAAISRRAARRWARIVSRTVRPRSVSRARVARRSSSSTDRAVSPRRSSRRSRRPVAGSVTPTRAATSPIRAPSGSSPSTSKARHCGNVSSKPVSASAKARVVSPTAPTAIRSRSSASASTPERATTVRVRSSMVTGMDGTRLGARWLSLSARPRGSTLRVHGLAPTSSCTARHRGRVSRPEGRSDTRWMRPDPSSAPRG